VSKAFFKTSIHQTFFSFFLRSVSDALFLASALEPISLRIAWALQQYLTIQFGEPGVSQILYGLLFLGTLLVLPQGILPSAQRWWTQRVHSEHESGPEFW
jgi:ABC-type branched-subunit amino acid transport system permease subunit